MEYGVGIVMKNIMDNLKMVKKTVMDISFAGKENFITSILVSGRKVDSRERDYQKKTASYTQ